MDVNFRSVEVRFKEPFVTHHGSRVRQRGMIVSAGFDDLVGYGECVESRLYGLSLSMHEQDMFRALPLLGDLNAPVYPPEIWSRLHELVGHNRFVLNALDQALWDLWARSQDKPLWKCLGLDPQSAISSSYTISLGSPASMVERLHAEPGWPIYKVKLGKEIDNVATVAELRRATRSRIIVDANCGWTPDECIRYGEGLKSLDVELIEQPLKPDDWSGMKNVHRLSSIPIFADEACLIEQDVRKCVGHYHGVNVKLMKCGGVTPALEMIRMAKSLGLQVMIGCMAGETSIGISVAAQLLPMIDYADLDSATLISNDPAKGVVIENGRCIYSALPGTGVVLVDEGDRVHRGEV